MAASSRRHRELLVVSMSLLGLADVAVSDVPFETLDLELAGLAEIDHNRFHDHWSPAPGVALSVSTPFHLGRLRLALELHQVDATTPDVPDFFVHAETLTWTLAASPHRWIRLEGGGLLGRYAMSFDSEEVSGFSATESELVVGALLAADVTVAGPVGVRMAASRRVVLTAVAIHQLYLSAGIRIRADTPSWLRELLR